MFRYFFLVLLALILLGLFNGLVFLPVLLVIVGPPAQVVAEDNAESLPPTTPLPSPVRYKAKPPKMKTSSRSSHDNSAFSSVKHSQHNHKRHNSDISLSTIAEETHSTASMADSHSVSSCDEQYNGTSVFIEPHITVETSTHPALVSQLVLTPPPPLITHFFPSDLQHRLLQKFLSSSGSSREGDEGDGHSQVQGGAPHPHGGIQQTLITEVQEEQLQQ